MPVQITTPLDLDALTREVEIVVSPTDPTLGTVRLVLREIPHGKWVTLLSGVRAASEARAREGAALAAKIEAGEASEAEAERFGALITADEQALYEQLRWGIADHVGEDFIYRGASVPFEGAPASYLGRPYTVAHNKDLTLYRVAGGGAGFSLGTLLPSIARAVLLFQQGRVESPAEQWARAEGEPEAPAEPGA